MSDHMLKLRDIPAGWDRFFFEERDLSISSIFRIVYAILTLCNIGFLWPYQLLWFGPEGFTTLESSKAFVHSASLTLFDYLPETNLTVRVCMSIFVVQTVLLLFGVFPRFHAACVFIWWVTFQHRNVIIFDGEDVLFRLFAFYLIFLPSADRMSFHSWRRRRKGLEPANPVHAVWPLRLLQIQMTVIYGSTIWEKFKGNAWVDGSALYYVSRLDDLWGRFPLPEFAITVLDSMPLLFVATWGVLLLELFIPIGLWIKELRIWAIIGAIVLHIGLDYCMNLLLFQWIMLCGLLAFATWKIPAGKRKVPTITTTPDLSSTNNPEEAPSS